MSRLKIYDKSIVIQKIDEITEDWLDIYNLHASINKSKGDNEYLNAGSIRGKRSLVFEVRYFADLEDIANNLQYYRIVYNNILFNIVDFDDFMLEHKRIKLVGESY